MSTSHSNISTSHCILSINMFLRSFLRRSATSLPRTVPNRGSHQTTIPAAVEAAKTKLTAHRDRKYIVLKDECASKSRTFPLLWLRDNCQCPECFHKASTSRIVDWSRFDLNIEPVDMSFNNDTSTLNITWSDRHRTAHSLDWLHARQFEPTAQRKYATQIYRPQRRPWTIDTFATHADAIRFRYDDVFGTDVGLHDWLHHLAVHGVAFIESAPLEQTAVRRLSERVAFIRQTHYGHEFQVHNKPDTHNVAYLSEPLQMHTDLPYYRYVPGVNLLHCLEQSHTSADGAFNLLCDGLTVADLMRTEWPAMFERLTRTPVDWLDVGEEDGVRFEKRYRAPMICLDRDGNVERINHSVPQRDSRFTCPLADVEPWYRALGTFVELIHANAVRFRTRPGDILTFDNTRLVHGRTGYVDSGDNVRHVVGAYLDWDEIYSRLNVLKASLSRKD